MESYFSMFQISSQRTRLFSLDVFRGAAIAGMILINSVEDTSLSQLQHTPWHGLTLADTIFPFFLWITGVAIVFSLKKRLEQGVDKKTIALQICKRSIILFILGFLLYNFPNYDLATVRILGVLQRIALCYLIGGLLFLWTGIRGQVVWTGILLIGYWIILTLAPVPGFGAGVLERDGNIVQYIDLFLLKGHLWSATWDPEGIVSTLGAITTLLFGLLTGQLLMIKQDSTKKILLLFFGAAVLVCLGLVMNRWLPINKNLWTSSYSVLMAGLALTVFSFLYFFLDVKEYRKWAKPFAIFGMNPITLYILSILIIKSLMILKVSGISLWDFVYNSLYGALKPNEASVMFALTYLLLLYVIAYGMYKKKWFFRI